jgi:excisionase family DNA binding protein
MDIISTREACEFLGVDRSTLIRWVDAGKVTPLRKFPGYTGGYIFYRAEIRRVAAVRAAAVAAAELESA